MSKTLLRLILVVCIALLASAAVFAQPPDTDGDGVIDRSDRCPTVPGPASNNGCPLPTATPQPQQPQPQPTETPLPTATPTPTLIPPAFIAPDGPCAVSPNGSRVNVREYPSTDAPIVGQLQLGGLYEVSAVVYLDDGTWFAVEGGWVSGVAVVAGGLCGEVSRLDAPAEGLVSSNKYDDAWPDAWGDPHEAGGPHVLAFDFPDEDGGTYMEYKLADAIITNFDSGWGDPHELAFELENVLISSYKTGEDGEPEFTGGYIIGDWDDSDNLFIIAVLDDPETGDPGASFIAQMLGDGSVKIGDFGLLLPYIEQDNLLLPYLEQDNAVGVLELPSLDILIGRNPDDGAAQGHVKVFDGQTGQLVSITDGTSNITDGTSNIQDGTSNTIGLPPDPDSQTREHILLARQVGVPAAADGSVVPGDGSVVPGDGSVVPGDGSVRFVIAIGVGVGDPTTTGLLLPAVQKVRLF